MSRFECCICGAKEELGACFTIENPVKIEFRLCPQCAERVRWHIRTMILSHPRDFRFPTPESDGGCRTFRIIFDGDTRVKGARGHPVARPRIKGTWMRLANQQEWCPETHTITITLDHPIAPEMVIFDLENDVYREFPRTEPVPSEGVSS